MFHLFHKRIHESIALSAQLAAALAMQMSWMTSWLAYRSEYIRQQFTLLETLGPISGIYLTTVLTYFVLFGICIFAFRGKDLTHWRERVFWFFLLSILMFILFTLPVVYEFQVVGRGGRT